MLLKGAFDALDEGKTGSITFRSIAYGKMGPKLKERLSDEAMESLTEDPAGEVDKEMYAATAGCARARCLHRSRCTIVGLCWVLVSNGAWLTRRISNHCGRPACVPALLRAYPGGTPSLVVSWSKSSKRRQSSRTFWSIACKVCAIVSYTAQPAVSCHAVHVDVAGQHNAIRH
jgi:hypothetical protein|eukprot:COSAG06_NODE_14393_length_1160_cov_5.574265_1_plen_173_part_00